MQPKRKTAEIDITASLLPVASDAGVTYSFKGCVDADAKTIDEQASLIAEVFRQAGPLFFDEEGGYIKSILAATERELQTAGVDFVVILGRTNEYGKEILSAVEVKFENHPAVNFYYEYAVESNGVHKAGWCLKDYPPMHQTLMFFFKDGTVLLFKLHSFVEQCRRKHERWMTLYGYRAKRSRQDGLNGSSFATYGFPVPISELEGCNYILQHEYQLDEIGTAVVQAVAAEKSSNRAKRCD